MLTEGSTGTVALRLSAASNTDIAVPVTAEPPTIIIAGDVTVNSGVTISMGMTESVRYT